MNNSVLENSKILLKFLNFPIIDGKDIFSCFANLPNAICENGKNKFERYVYIPGTRKDRVVLVAHTDTIWDENYRDIKGETQNVILENGIFKGTNPKLGIGADDRAGCAMLWALKDSGHSLLLVDGEEKGKIGANFLKKHNPKLFKELNHHQFMLEFDWVGTNGCLYNQVDNTNKFKKFIETTLKFTDSKARGGTDLAILCHKICGVTLGVGYHKHHTIDEFLVLSEWENTLTQVNDFLSKPLPRFTCKFFAPRIRFAKNIAHKLLKFLKLKK